MYSPCFECMNRYGKQYSEECDNTCEYAVAVKFIGELQNEIKVLQDKIALAALKEQESRNYNPKLTLEDLQKLNDRLIWWDYYDDWVMCREGYVVMEYRGTFSFDFVLSHGSVYRYEPD